MSLELVNIQDINTNTKSQGAPVTSNTGIGVRNMTKYFGTNNAAVPGSVPMNAWVHGLIIEDRDLSRHIYKGLRANHIPFQYFEAVPQDAKTADYDQLETVGRFEKINLYKGSHNNEFELVLKYYAEGTEDPRYDHKTKWTIEQIDRLVKRLKSLVYPAYDGNYGPPNRALFNMGASFVDVPVVIKNISVNNRAPYRISDGMSMFREVNLSMTTDYPLNQAIGAELIEEATYIQTSIDNGSTLFSKKSFNLRSRRNR